MGAAGGRGLQGAGAAGTQPYSPRSRQRLRRGRPRRAGAMTPASSGPVRQPRDPPRSESSQLRGGGGSGIRGRRPPGPLRLPGWRKPGGAGGDGGERHGEGSRAGQHLQPGRWGETATARRPDPRVSPERRCGSAGPARGGLRPREVPRRLPDPQGDAL